MDSFIVWTDSHISSPGIAGWSTITANWIVEHKDSLNIKAVLHMGDVGHLSGYQTHTLAVMEILYDADIPLLISPGNHDYDLDNATVWASNTRPLTRWNEAYGVHRHMGKPWYGGVYEYGNAGNAYYYLVINDKFFLRQYH